MRCKVPAASRPRGLRATHAPPRRPEVTPAAHTDRMLQTPPDIATRSQSAGRSVNLPAAASAAPRAGTGPAGARPPSSGASLEPGSFHSSGVSLSTRHPIPCLPRGPPNPRVGPLGSALGFSAQQTREVLAFALGFLGNLFVFSEARGAEGRFFRWKRMPTCPGGCPLPHSPGQGATISSRELPERPWPAYPWQPQALNRPLGMEVRLTWARPTSTLLWS